MLYTNPNTVVVLLLVLVTLCVSYCSGYYPPRCSLCQKPLSMKDVLIDCAGFNPVRELFFLFS